MSATWNSSAKRAMRESVCNRYGGRCAYCRAVVGLRRGTLDHYMPQALGGTNEASNLRWACLPCNAEKADMHPDQWEARKPSAAVKTAAERRLEILARCAPRAPGRGEAA